MFTLYHLWNDSNWIMNTTWEETLSKCTSKEMKILAAQLAAQLATQCRWTDKKFAKCWSYTAGCKVSNTGRRNGWTVTVLPNAEEHFQLGSYELCFLDSIKSCWNRCWRCSLTWSVKRASYTETAEKLCISCRAHYSKCNDILNPILRPILQKTT
jgi:hypothetical protein